MTRARNPRAAQAMAEQMGLPLLASVKADARVSRAREQGLAPPSGAFAALVALDGVPVA